MNDTAASLGSLCGSLSCVLAPFIVFYFGYRILTTIKNNRNAEKWNSVYVGMPVNDVLIILGNPRYKDQVSISDKGKKERWVYGRGNRNLNYVYMENDKLISCTINRIF